MSTHATHPELRTAEPAPPRYEESMEAWIITRYDDVVAVLRDTERFSAVNAIGIRPFSKLPLEVRSVLERGLPRFPGIIEMDPPDHTRYRRLVNEGFTPRRVAALEPMMRRISDELLDALEGGSQADFVRAFCDPLPIRVIGEILGVPRSDTDHVQRLSDSFRTFEAGTINELPLTAQIETAELFLAFQEYVLGLVEERRRSPGADLVSVLIQTPLADERPLTTEELVSTVIHLLFAGQETTTRLIASMLDLLLSERSLWERLIDEPELADNATEESLRLAPPVTYHSRQAGEDVAIGGAQIRAGDALHLVFAAANRDPDVFPEPERFDLQRGNASRHLGLGRGIHFCVGAPIGRLEAKVALEALTQRLPSLRPWPGETPRRETHMMLSGLATLPVEWDAVVPQPV